MLKLNNNNNWIIDNVPMNICFMHRSQTVNILNVIVNRWLIVWAITGGPPTVGVRGDFGVATFASKTRQCNHHQSKVIKRSHQYFWEYRRWSRRSCYTDRLLIDGALSKESMRTAQLRLTKFPVSCYSKEVQESCFRFQPSVPCYVPANKR